MDASEVFMQGEGNMLSLSEACRELSISLATGRNWVRLGKLDPSGKRDGSPFFARSYVENLKAELQCGKNTALKSRRNKKYVSGSQMNHSYLKDSSVNKPVIKSLLAVIEDSQIEVTEEILCMLIAECAVRLIGDKYGRKRPSKGLADYYGGKQKTHRLSFLVEDLLRPYPFVPGILELYSELFGFGYAYEEGEDVLGLLYLSLKSIRSRKALGAYYTPSGIVKSLCSRLFGMNEAAGRDVLDPCCGTGNFILQLPPQISPRHVFGNDMDAISVKIARINYALKYDIADASVIYSHITEGDFLLGGMGRRYGFIIGNPPWGYDFSEAQKRLLQESYGAVGSGLESYDLFIEQALRHLQPDGLLSFVLPEAILNVKAHAPIRRRMLESCVFQYIEYLGNAFDRVQCPSIILQMALDEGKPGGSRGLKGTVVQDGAREYSIQRKRETRAGGLSFAMTDEEYGVVEKMDSVPGKATLAGQARFALGIVTGDNKRFLSKEKSEGKEMVLRGADLYKFKYRPSDCCLAFQPELFQQAAPAFCYRAKEKLLYRFVCSQLVFAYDDAQTLSLNSCNLLIPEIEGLGMKYILAVLNARAAQFYFKKKFRSMKVLRSQIEEIPIPFVEKERQDKIVGLVDIILKASDAAAVAGGYEALEEEVSKLYGLSAEDCRIIQKSMEGEKLYLPIW